MTIEPRHLSGLAALVAAESTYLRKMKDEMDTAFVKRIVCAYMNAPFHDYYTEQGHTSMCYGVRTEDWEAAVREICADLLPELEARAQRFAIARNLVASAHSDDWRTSGGSATHR